MPAPSMIRHLQERDKNERTTDPMKADAVFQETFEEMRRDPGVILFTALQWIPERSSLRRLFTSHPDEYPVGGEKTVEISPGWLGTVIEDKKPFLAADLNALREVFADSELIQRLGCGAVINVPVLDDGRNVVGVLALLDAEGRYTATQCGNRRRRRQPEPGRPHRSLCRPPHRSPREGHVLLMSTTPNTQAPH